MPPSGGIMGVAVDLAIFTVQEARLELLLIRMKREPYTGKWALPGGRIRGDETVERRGGARAAREGRPRATSISSSSTPSPSRRAIRAARCISVAHLALIRGDVQLRTTDKYSGIGWFPVDAAAAARVRPRADRRATRSSGCAPSWSTATWRATCSSKTFTLGELQRLYETILGRRLDARNFQRRAQQIGLVKDTGRMRRGQAYRPARLFRFA